MQQMSPINPALASLLQVANMVTPEQTPTVAAQVANAAGVPTMPPQGMPQQGMPQGGQQQQQPGLQSIMQQAQTGGQIQQMQQQQQQQEQQQQLQAVMQMLQQQQARQNAMRFGVAAAPGAKNVRMAEGGIVGYSAGNPEPHPLNDPDELKKVRERLARKAYEAFRARSGTAAGAATEAAEAAAPAASRGILSTLGRLLPSRVGVVGAVADPRGTAQSLLETMPLLKMLNIGMGDATQLLPAGGLPSLPRAGSPSGRRLDDPNDPRIMGATPPEETTGLEVERARNMAAAGHTPPVQEAPPPRPPAGPGGPARPAGPSMPQVPQVTGPSQVDKYFGDARTAVSGIETALPSPADVGKRATESAAAQDAFLRSRGIDPDQYKKDLEASEARQTRKIGEIDKIAREREEARAGLPGLIRMLTAAGGRTDPLTAVGREYGAQVAERLADNERFMNARERVMDAEDTIKVAIRDKQRAEAAGKFKEAEAATQKELEARNAKRTAEANLALETAKVLSGKEEKALDRQTQVLTTQMQVNAQREAAAATREGTLETRRASIIANVNRDEDRAMASIEANYNKRVTAIGLFPGAKPTPEQTKALQEAQAERDAANALVRSKAAETRALVMGGTGSSGNIKVERIK